MKDATRRRLYLVAAPRDNHVLGLEVAEDPRPRLSEVALEDGLPHRVHIHVEVEVLDGVHVELDGDEALRRGEHLLHVHRHLGSRSSGRLVVAARWAGGAKNKTNDARRKILQFRELRWREGSITGGWITGRHDVTNSQSEGMMDSLAEGDWRQANKTAAK